MLVVFLAGLLVMIAAKSAGRPVSHQHHMHIPHLMSYAIFPRDYSPSPSPLQWSGYYADLMMQYKRSCSGFHGKLVADYPTGSSSQFRTRRDGSTQRLKFGIDNILQLDALDDKKALTLGHFPLTDASGTVSSNPGPKFVTLVSKMTQPMVMTAVCETAE
ncbi:unnamed protein product [Soboliphyme baturini]|uniref:Secreted protein n=1 Tax=Soboliphyme baturini TaxID=241478 RepID=A0A183IMT0_9BILA|nr:unnamed protein product [Soboliphyme baturini]